MRTEQPWVRDSSLSDQSGDSGVSSSPVVPVQRRRAVQA